MAYCININNNKLDNLYILKIYKNSYYVKIHIYIIKKNHIFYLLPNNTRFY